MDEWNDERQALGDYNKNVQSRNHGVYACVPVFSFAGRSKINPDDIFFCGRRLGMMVKRHKTSLAVLYRLGGFVNRFVSSRFFTDDIYDVEAGNLRQLLFWHHWLIGTIDFVFNGRLSFSF